MNYVVLIYSLYLAFTLAITIWVASSLLKNGRIFLLDLFHKEKALSDSVASLLNVGIYLISIGFAFKMLRVSASDIAGMQQVIEVLSEKLGAFIIVLGLLLFTDLLILLGLRSKRE